MCRELVEDAEILALQQNIKTKSEISPGIEVRGNELYLLRTLLNLLDNTMKYNVDGVFPNYQYRTGNSHGPKEPRL